MNVMNNIYTDFPAEELEGEGRMRSSWNQCVRVRALPILDVQTSAGPEKGTVPG